MNCRLFQNQIFEYLDGSLPPRAQVAAEEHLSACAACRLALSREQQTAQSLSDEFRNASASLRLPQDFGHNLLSALANERHARDEQPGIVLFWRRLAWPLVAAAAGLLVLAGALFLMRAPGPGMARPRPRSAGSGVTVQLSYVVPTYTFRQEGGFVIDALSYRTNFVNQRFPASRAHLE
jgi:anti-sigma factor RsiW